MKYFRLFAFVCLFSGVARAQTLLPGALLPALPQQFLNANGSPAANGRLCTQASGTNTALAVYSDPGLTMPLPNPIKLNAAGIATTNGTTQTAVYTSAASYRVTLYGPSNNGIGSCNGQPVGALIWQFDGIYDFGQLNGGTGGGGGGGSAHPCTTGADMAAKITAAYSTLPSSGGIIDCSNLITPQSLGTDPFTGMTVPATIIFPVVTSTSTVALNIPPNVTLLFPQGAILVNSNKTNVSGRIDAGNWQIFSGSGQVCFGISTVCNVANGFTKSAVPQWWGALGNGVILGTETGTTGCNGTGGTAILSCAGANFTSADVGKHFDLAHAGASNCGQQYWSIGTSTFNCNLVGTILSVNSTTQVTLSVNLANTVSGEQFAYVLQEEGFIKAAILSGVSQITINGAFGVTSPIFMEMNNQSVIGTGGAASRLIRVGPVAYGTDKQGTFAVDNGSNNLLFQGISIWGTNELGELNTFGATPDGLIFCSGIPNGLGGACNSSAGINNIRIINCDFSYTWGIGLHFPGSGTTLGQRVNNVFISNSTASFNSYDGINPIIYDGLVINAVESMHNGTGGIELAVQGGSLTITASQFKYNKSVGASAGGFTDGLTHTASCQITGNDFSENGNGSTVVTSGIGMVMTDGIQNCTVSGNVFRHNHQNGLTMSAGPQDQNITITGNIFSSNGIISASAATTAVTGIFQNTTMSDNLITDEATSQILTATRTSNVVSVTTLTPHNYAVGYSVVISGSPAGWIDGTWTLTAVTDDLNFKFAQTAANAGPTAGGTTYSAGSGFTQAFGMVVNGATNTQWLNNTIRYSHTRNIDLSGINAFNDVFASNSNFPNAGNTDLYIGSIVPSIAGLAVRIPDIQTTGNVCTTAAGAGSTCTTVITHNLQITPNNTQCVLDNTPNAQSGTPLLIKVDTSTSATTATVTIGNFTAVASGGGTMRCKTNYAY